MKYLSIAENSDIGFKSDGINQIFDTDVLISDEIYNQFFINQSQGKRYKIKDINGATFDEIFEEYTLLPTVLSPSDNEIMAQTIANLQIAITERDTQLEELAQTIADMQLI